MLLTLTFCYANVGGDFARLASAESRQKFSRVKLARVTSRHARCYIPNSSDVNPPPLDVEVDIAIGLARLGEPGSKFAHPTIPESSAVA